MALLVRGTDSFSLRGPAKWGKRATGLDQVRLRYAGSASRLTAFLATLADWAACPTDGNLFLEGFDNNDDPIHPEVEVSYIGRRGGVLPSVQIQHGTSLATTSKSDGDVQVDILYRSPHTVHTWIATTDAMTYTGFSSPQSSEIIQVRVNGHIPLVLQDEDWYKTTYTYARASDAERARIDAYWAANATLLAAAKTTWLAFYTSGFDTEDQVSEFTAVELVPGEYFQCRSVTSEVLVPP